MKHRLRNGDPVDCSAMLHQDPRLYKAALQYFTNYYDCYPELGLSQKDRPRHRHYADAQEVIDAILERNKRGFAMSVRVLISGPKKYRDISLLPSGRDFFRQLAGRACRCERIAVDEWKEYWAEFDEIRRRHRKGLSLSSRVLATRSAPHRNSTLVDTARKYFGSWPRAVNLALSIK